MILKSSAPLLQNIPPTARPVSKDLTQQILQPQGINIDALELQHKLSNPMSAPLISFHESDPPQQQPTAPIQSHFELEINDSDGFLQFSTDDIKANLSGKTSIDGSFILEQLAKIPDTKDVAFNPPKFDSDRQQYVLSGKGLNKILGIFDVGFEVRLGTQKGQLAFQVDSGIKRGIIYKILAKQLDKVGLSSEKQDKQLLLKPSYSQSIDIPLKKDGSHTGRIDQIISDSEKVQFEINKQGQLSIVFDAVEVEISSSLPDSEKQVSSSAAPSSTDQAHIEFQLKMDENLKPEIQIQDGQIQSQTELEALKGILPENTLTQLRDQIGTALSLNLNQIQGEIGLNKTGFSVDAAAQLEISGDQQANVSAALSASLHKEQSTFKAQNLSLQTQTGHHLSVKEASYQAAPKDTTEQSSLNITQANGQIDMAGIQAEIEGLDARIELPRKDSEQALNVKAEGKIQGQISQTGLNASFEISGKHQASLSAETLNIELEKAEIRSDFVQSPEASQKEKTEKARDFSIQIAQANLKGTVRTEQLFVDAESSISGAKIDINPEGDIQLDLEAHQTTGTFQQSRSELNIKADLNGHTQAEIKGKDISVTHREGHFTADVQSKDKIGIVGTGQDLDLDLKAGNDIQIAVSKPDLNTTIKAQNNLIQAQTTGEKAHLHMQGQSIDIKTENTQSNLQLKIGDNVKGTGRSGDVSVQIRPNENGSGAQKSKQNIALQAEKTDLRATIGNKQGNLDVSAHAVGDLDLTISGQNVRLESESSSTEVGVKLFAPNQPTEKKADISAQGGNFKLNVQGKDLTVALEEASYNGQITPNKKINVDLQSQASSELSLNVSQTRIGVSSGAALKGNFALENKVSTQFHNANGFDLEVLQKQKGNPGSISASVGKLNLAGSVHTNGVQADITGSGDFRLDLENQGGPVEINYDGRLEGSTQVKELLKGDIKVEGPVNVNLQGQELSVDLNGGLNLDAHSPKLGIDGKIQVAPKEGGFNLSVKDKQLAVSLADKGVLKLDNLKDLNLNNPELEKVLQHLLSNEAEISYQNVSLNGQNLGLGLQSSALETSYGSVSLEMKLEKSGTEVQVEKGHMNFEPNKAFYEVLQESLSEKFNITIKGTPKFEDGKISVEGEVRTPLGLIQLANFQISTTVEDNKLIFDIDKANVFQVIGKNGVARFMNKMLNKTDIDVFKSSNNSLEIELADIVKDLSLTHGVNFTDLKLVDSHFEVGFYFSTQDQKIARAATEGDLTGLNQLLKQYDLSEFSGESLATAFSSFAKAKDSKSAVSLLQQTASAYLKAGGQERYELTRALNWIAKSTPARKADIEDNIALDFVKPHLNNPSGQQYLKQMPHDFIEQLSKNLDSSDLGSWDKHWVTGEEKRAAETLRKLNQLPD